MTDYIGAIVGFVYPLGVIIVFLLMSMMYRKTKDKRDFGFWCGFFVSVFWPMMMIIFVVMWLTSALQQFYEGGCNDS